MEEKKTEAQVVIGRPKVVETKKNEKFISFPVYFNLNGLILIVRGFRVMRGALYPPATRVGAGQYVNVCLGNGVFAERLYKTVKEQGVETEAWGKALEVVGGLLEVGDATDYLLYDALAMRLSFE